MSYLGRKVLKDDRAKGMTHRCPECGNTMTSTGELYKTAGMPRWSVAFWCPYDQEEFPIWTPALQPLIETVTQGVDVDALSSF